MGTAPKTMTVGQLKDLGSALLQAIPGDLPFDVAGYWIGRKKELGDKVRMILLNGQLQAKTLPDINWQEAYKALGMSAEYESEVANLAISGNTSLWTIPVIKGATCNKAVAALRELGVDVYTCVNDLDKDVSENDRDPKRDGSYQVSFRQNVEADEENKNQSANRRREQGCKDITLLERLLLELGYFLTTGKHLDIENITLCSGSRGSGGHGPYARWYDVGFYVYWAHSDYSSDHLCARSVVSLPTKQA